MSDTEFALAWPRDLFVSEATRILGVPNPQNFDGMAQQLLIEAFKDEDILHAYTAETGPQYEWDASPTVTKPPTKRQWLTALVRDGSRLAPFRRPDYWATRNGLVPERKRLETTSGQLAFTRAFEMQISELASAGYFPKILPTKCFDDEEAILLSDVAIKLTDAIGTNVNWPLTGDHLGPVPDPILFSLIEYFHDQSQRPRTSSEHKYCGLHFHTFNRAAGEDVYRWKLNRLLETYNIHLRMGAIGAEQGRLVKHFGTPLDSLADAQIETRATRPEDEVAEAIRGFRSRDATLALKRASLALLAGDLERRRAEVKKALLTRDEADLFQIANQFAIRHRKDDQKDDYRAEYLDWIFWSYLSTVALMDSLTAE